MTQSIAQRYAKALFILSEERSLRDAVYQDLKKIYTLIHDSPDFREFLENPVVACNAQQTILENIFKGKLNKATYQFLFFLQSKKRLNCLEAACDVFEQLYLEHKGVVKVQITGNVPLNDQQVGEITTHLKARLNHDIQPHVDVDPSILGGVKIREGDTIYDYSVRAQLKQFKKETMAA